MLNSAIVLLCEVMKLNTINLFLKHYGTLESVDPIQRSIPLIGRAVATSTAYRYLGQLEQSSFFQHSHRPPNCFRSRPM